MMAQARLQDGAAIADVKRKQGRVSNTRGLDRERMTGDILEREGWSILARRLRTAAGEIDLVADRGGLTAVVEVKSRSTLAEAAHALSERQQRRIVAATEIALASNPDWGRVGVRFDLFIFDARGDVRRIQDAFSG